MEKWELPMRLIYNVVLRKSSINYYLLSGKNKVDNKKLMFIIVSRISVHGSLNPFSKINNISEETSSNTSGRDVSNRVSSISVVASHSI